MSSAMVGALGLAREMSYASGLRLYATVAVLGLLQRFGAVHLPASLRILGNSILIAIALAHFALEFLANKIHYMGSAWNAICPHTDVECDSKATA